MIKLSQGSDPSIMVVTWSGPAASTYPANSVFGRVSGSVGKVNYGLSATQMTSSADDSSYSPRYYKYQSNDCLGNVLPLGSTYGVEGMYASPLFHSVTISGLTPATMYYYQIIDPSGTQSATLTFSTLPAVGSNIMANGKIMSLAVMADVGTYSATNILGDPAFTGTTPVNGDKPPKFNSDAANTVANINSNSNVGLLTITGDLSYSDGNAPVYDVYDLQMQPTSQRIPMFVTAGNHEQDISVGVVNQFGDSYSFLPFENRYKMPSQQEPIWSKNTFGKTAFASPAPTINGVPAPTKCYLGLGYGDHDIAPPAGYAVNGGAKSSVSLKSFQGGYDYGNSYYSFNAGLAHMIVLNSYANYTRGSLQWKWLETDLKAVDRTKTPWIVSHVHTPWYNTNTNKHDEYEQIRMRYEMEPLFKQYKVNFQFSGHTHVYERFGGIYDNKPDDTATIYMTVGTGGVSLDQNAFVPFTDPTTGVAMTTVPGYTATTGLAYEPYFAASKYRFDLGWGYGELQFLSADVAKWSYHVNLQTQMVTPPLTKDVIDTVTICNINGASASTVCPPTQMPTPNPSNAPTSRPTMTAFPTVAPTFGPTVAVGNPTATPSEVAYATVRIVQVFTGVSPTDPDFTASLKSIIASLLNIPVTSITINKFSASSAKRRQLVQTSAEVDYTVKAPNVAASTLTTTLTASTFTTLISTNLQQQGFIGVTAAAPVVITTPPTAGPTTSPTNAPVASANKLSTDAIVGIVIGSVAGFLLLVAGIYYAVIQSKSGDSMAKTGDEGDATKV